MAHLVVESTEKLWHTWNIRALVLLSLLLQFFLCLCAQLRRQRGGKWVVVIWLAYLLADWVPTFTISLILQTESSEILALWASFLLLHLGGPDNITSFSLQDNEQWIRHAFGFMFRVGSTFYIQIRPTRDQKDQSTPSFPTALVLLIGIGKCVERICAFYQASFDQYGEDEIYFFRGNEGTVSESTSYILGQELSPYGTIKNLLVGPLLSSERRKRIRLAFLQKGWKDILLMLEIELSLLYEALHTKLPLPLLDSEVGIIIRLSNFVFILGAFVSFSSNTKHYELEMFEIWLTYGLLVGVITVDFMSIGFFLLSDFKFLSSSTYTVRHPDCGENRDARILRVPEQEEKLRWSKTWSKTIPQCDFITYNDYPEWLDSLLIQTILEAVRGIQCLSSQNLREDREWRFIFEELKKKALEAETVEMGKNICLKRGDGILDTHEEYRDLSWSVKELDYTKSLLTWHIATEVCFRNEAQGSTSSTMDYKKISRLISNYMFYLLQMEPAMMAAVSVDWKAVRREARRDLENFCKTQSIAARIDLFRAIFSECPGSPSVHRLGEKSVLFCANKLANQLKEGPNGLPWELMSQVWVEIMCYAAINCRPNVHAQQPSKGGQLLTFVWLLMNHFGLGTQFETERAVGDDKVKSVGIQCAVDDDEEKNVVIQCAVDDDAETNVVIKCAVENDESDKW